MNRELPKVSVVTITYGHEKYIAETLDGILMQQYDGPVEFIIANDNSPDATDEVVKKYFLENPAPSNFEIKYTKHETNKGMMPNFIWALEQATGKYIALCEGDDYWTDPLKLQKQVDFLESHPDYSVTFHRCKHYNVETHEMIDDNCGYLFADNNQLGVDITTAQFFKTWITQPLTMVYRVASFDLDVALQYLYYRDMHQIYHLLQAGKGYLFAFDGGVRTMHEGGIASLISPLDQCEKGVAIAKELYDKNRTIETKQYYESMLQWYLYNINQFKKRRVSYSLQLLQLNRNFKKAIRNLLR